MLRAVKEWLKNFELVRMIGWIRDQSRAAHETPPFKRCGPNVRIAPQASLSHPHMISIGDNVLIHQGVMINGAGGLVIGNNVGISYRVTIWTVDHTFHEGDEIPFDRRGVLRPVLINDNVAIGANAVIMPGVEIGEGAIVGMGAVVTSDIKPLSVVFGNPARTIGIRDQSRYEGLRDSGRFHDFSRSGNYGVPLVPVYVQQRPRLYEIVRSEVEEGRAVLETRVETTESEGAQPASPRGHTSQEASGR